MDWAYRFIRWRWLRYWFLYMQDILKIALLLVPIAVLLFLIFPYVEYLSITFIATVLIVAFWITLIAICFIPHPQQKP